MKQSVFRYNTIFMQGSLQSVGHTMDYFIKHTRKLVIYVIMPRFGGISNELWMYKNGKVQEKRMVATSSNLFLYYVLWFYHHTTTLFTYFSRNEHVFVLAGHPIAFFGMSIMKLFRNVRYAYWIGDYYPPVHWSLILFEKLKKYYHDRIPFTYYLSDRINKILNGKVVTLANKKTVMWGVKAYSGPIKTISTPFKLLFVGAIRPSQGIEDLLMLVKSSPDVQLSILGSCEASLYKKYMSLIRSYGIVKQIWFPNTFINDDKLRKLARLHHVGIALYEKGEHTATHYTDPGKVKTYIELGLPVVMTDTSAIVSFIRKFNAGFVIDSVSELSTALKKIQTQYTQYQQGVASFSQYFDYEKYYKRAFLLLENV